MEYYIDKDKLHHRIRPMKLTTNLVHLDCMNRSEVICKPQIINISYATSIIFPHLRFNKMNARRSRPLTGHWNCMTTQVTSGQAIQIAIVPFAGLEKGDPAVKLPSGCGSAYPENWPVRFPRGTEHL